MEILGSLCLLGAGVGVLFLLLKFSHKCNLEYAERWSKVLGEQISTAIKDASENLKK